MPSTIGCRHCSCGLDVAEFANQDVLIPGLKHCVGFQLVIKLHEDPEANVLGPEYDHSLEICPIEDRVTPSS